MAKTLEFPALLRLIDEQSVVFRALVGSASSLEVPVPSCPGWTLFDLAQHLGEVHRQWAANVAAGPADAPAGEAVAHSAPAAHREREDLLAWSAESTAQLLGALREAGPDRGCWTWWGPSESPQTSGAVARHQVQEVSVHTYDAQTALGAPQPLPDEAALDGVEEFLSTCAAWASPWPHKPATLDFHATEGRSWRLALSAEGARTTRLAPPGTTPDAAAGTASDTAADAAPDATAGAASAYGARAARLSTPGTAAGTAPDAAAGTTPGVAVGVEPDAVSVSVRGTASELVLGLYGRIPVDSLELHGDPRLFELLEAWEPE